MSICLIFFFFFSSRRRHTRFDCDWSSDVCSSDLEKRAVEDQVSAEHEGIEPEISGRGGRVLKRFRHALNGVKIEIDRNEVAALAALPGVVAVLPVLKHRPNNAVSVPFIGAPVVWQGTPRLRGEGVKIAIISTGIDYTHANFGGPGPVAGVQAAAAASTQPAHPALFR